MKRKRKFSALLFSSSHALYLQPGDSCPSKSANRSVHSVASAINVPGRCTALKLISGA
jgi:hypothetical protein